MKRFYIITLILAIVMTACDNDNPVPDSDSGTGVDMTGDCRHPQETGSYATFFKPPNGFVGDPMPFYDADGQTFRLYFLYENANNHPIYEVQTKDYASYEGFSEVLPAGNTGSQDEWIGTGSFIKKDNVWYCFYTGHNGNLNPAEKVMTATSTDLKNWVKKPSATFAAPDGFDKNNFRDPFVYFDETRSSYVMLVATGRDNKGVIARFTSSDLLQWTEIEPFTDFESDAEMLECPDLFKMGNKWYLVFSRMNRDVHRKTFYRIADTPEGPWRVCRDAGGHHETFDGLYLYGGKTASDGNNRYLSGWCSTGQEVNANNELDWAGTLVSHQLVQQPEGRLYPVIPEAVDNKFAEKIDFKEIRRIGNVTGTIDHFTINGGSVVFNRNASLVKIAMKIDASQATKNFGVAFGACGDQDDVYSLRFDLTENHYGLPAIFMYHNQEELNFTPLTVPVSHFFDIQIVIEKSVCVLYVNHNVAFTNRIYGMNQNPWMIFADEGTVTFSDMEIYKQ